MIYGGQKSPWHREWDTGNVRFPAPSLRHTLFVRQFELVVLGGGECCGQPVGSNGPRPRGRPVCLDTVVCFEILAGIIESMYHRSDLSTLGTYPPGLSWNKVPFYFEIRESVCRLVIFFWGVIRGLSLLIAAYVGHVVVNEILALTGGIYFAVRFF